jgi:putative hydrolase of the HAD superfamily
VIRFVIFDLFHTLVHSQYEDWERAAADMAAITGVEPAALLTAYQQTWRQRQVEWGSEQTVRILAERVGGSPSQAQVAEAAAVRRAVASRILSTASESAIGVLDAVRAAGYRTGLVSNATADTSETWPATALATRFDAAIFSCEVGAAKPDPRIYLAATTALRAKPAECLYIGDGADGELAGAKALGMTAIRTTQHADSDPAWPGPAITSLAEVRALLPARS